MYGCDRTLVFASSDLGSNHGRRAGASGQPTVTKDDDMLKEFRKATGGDASEGVKEILDLVKMDWPGAAKAMERLGKFLGDTVTVPGSEGHKPLAFAVYEKALAAYQEAMGQEDPVRLAALIETLLTEAADGLTKVEIVDAVGRVWNPADGKSVSEWNKDRNKIEVREGSQPMSKEDLYDILMTVTTDGTTRQIIAEAKTYYPEGTVPDPFPKPTTSLH